MSAMLLLGAHTPALGRPLTSFERSVHGCKVDIFRTTEVDEADEAVAEQRG